VVDSLSLVKTVSSVLVVAVVVAVIVSKGHNKMK